MNIHSSYDRSGLSRCEMAYSSGLGRQLILKSYSLFEGVTMVRLICKGTKVAFSLESNCLGSGRLFQSSASDTVITVLYIFIIACSVLLIGYSSNLVLPETMQLGRNYPKPTVRYRSISAFAVR